MKIRIEPFTPAHFLALNPSVEQVNTALLSHVSGPAYTLMTDERKPKILGCGGIRTLGIGQAWALIDPEAVKDHPILIARKSAVVLEACIAEEKLYRVYAEATKESSPHFFSHLGFHNSDRLYVR